MTQRAGHRHRLIKPKITLKAAVILAALGLSACGLTDTPPPAQAPTTAPTTPAPASASPPAPGTGPSLAALPPPALIKQYPAPSILSGMTPNQVIGLLGPPRFKRRDNPAEIWQYRNKACALDLFLYRAETGTNYKVRHFETRARGAEKIAAKACFSGLLQDRENRPRG